jgi:TonB family protein
MLQRCRTGVGVKRKQIPQFAITHFRNSYSLFLQGPLKYSSPPRDVLLTERDILSPTTLSLTQAVASGNVQAVRDLLAEGAPVNGSTSGGQTPLILAVIYGYTDVLRLLLSAGADPQLRDDLGLNAFEWAERRGFAEGTKLLANRQVSPRTTTRGTPVDSTPPPKEPDHRVEPKIVNPVDDQTPSGSQADEKTRRWLEGIRQRFDEEARRQIKEKPAKSRDETSDHMASSEAPGEYPRAGASVPNDNSVSRSAAPLDHKVGPPREDPPYSVSRSTQPLGATSRHDANRSPGTSDPIVAAPHTSASTASRTVSKRKRCPRCNTVYDGELLGYCAYHVVALVDDDKPLPVTPPPAPTASSSTTLLGILIFVALSTGAATTYLITRYLEQQRASAPPPILAAAKKETLVFVSSELKGKELSLPTPEYPEKAKAQGISGTIMVRVRIDNKGKVIAAQAMNGDLTLRAAAVEAAFKATFSPEKLNEETTGTIVYSFTK